MTRQAARVVANFDRFMHTLHGVPLAVILCDLLLFKDSTHVHAHRTTLRQDSRAISLYGIGYFAWSCLVRYRNGRWAYPFQDLLPLWLFVPVHLSFFACSYGILWAAWRIRRRVHGLPRSPGDSGDGDGVANAAEAKKPR